MPIAPNCNLRGGMTLNFLSGSQKVFPLGGGCSPQQSVAPPVQQGGDQRLAMPIAPSCNLCGGMTLKFLIVFRTFVMLSSTCKTRLRLSAGRFGDSESLFLGPVLEPIALLSPISKVVRPDGLPGLVAWSAA